MKVVLAFDQGTTSSRAIAFDSSGAIVGIAQREFKQHYPNPGWVEHDPSEIWDSQLAVAREVLQECNLTADDVAAIGITNQRETTVLWDRTTGEPVYNAIVWQDRRTAADCDSFRNAGHESTIQEKTGLLIDAYFCATKIRWVLQNVPRARELADAGNLAFGTIDSWLLWHLTGGEVHATDASNASRTMLLNIQTCQWDDDLLSLFEIPREILPSVHPSSHVYGETKASLLGKSIPVGGLAGDQQSALFGQACTSTGMVKNTYGTGCFLLMNVGDEPSVSKCKLLSTVACTGAANRQYALEGSVFVGGAAIQWLRDELQIIESSAESEAIAMSVDDSDGVIMVPAFAGLGAPHWDSYARGTIVGITRGTSRAHIVRAALESIAFQVADVLEAMKKDASMPIQQLRVDGGASANNFLMQFQADVAQVPVVRPKVIETTSLGAAMLSGLATGFWKDPSELESVWQQDRMFEPEMSAKEATDRKSRWADALQRSLNWEPS